MAGRTRRPCAKFARVRGAVLWLLLGVFALVPPTAIAASAAQRVTLRLQTQFDPTNHRFWRLIAATRTVSGGSWQIRSDRTGWVLPHNAYFRARWRGEYSEVELLRAPATIWANWRPARRVVVVSVSTWTSGQSLRGRYVELQRRVSGTDSWVRVRRALLMPTQGIGMFRARFSVQTRGLTLRVVVPAVTGAPCFTAAASDSWRS
jgi:hypothetical protein